MAAINLGIVRILLFGAMSFGSIATLAQNGKDQLNYDHEYRSKKCIVHYSYVVEKGASVLTGEIVDIRTGGPIYNINIEIKGSNVGTVPDLEGKFSLSLPKRTGVIVFDKIGFEKFEFNYKFNPKPVFTHQ